MYILYILYYSILYCTVLHCIYCTILHFVLLYIVLCSLTQVDTNFSVLSFVIIMIMTMINDNNDDGSEWRWWRRFGPPALPPEPAYDALSLRPSASPHCALLRRTAYTVPDSLYCCFHCYLEFRKYLVADKLQRNRSIVPPAMFLCICTMLYVVICFCRLLLLYSRIPRPTHSPAAIRPPSIAH